MDPTHSQWMRNCPDSFVYAQDQSRVLSFGIDSSSLSSSRATRGGPGPKQAEKDAAFIAGKVCDRLIGAGAGDKNEKVKIYTPSANNDKCTAAGIEQAFKEELEQIGADGLLIFMFVGSAMAQPGGSCSICPVDYDPNNEATHITADKLLKWISSGSNQLQKHVLFVLSCPLADKLVEGTVDVETHFPIGNVSIHSLGVTTGVENALGLILCILDHSFFAFFFDHFMRNASKSQAGNFMLKQSFTQVCQCCEALSSLVATYRNGELKSNDMEAVLAYVKHDGMGETDSSGQVGRFEFLSKHLDPKKRSVILHPKVDAFLDYVSEYEDGPIWVLKNNGVLANESVLETCFCVMVLSLASFQAAENKKCLEEPIAFFQVFMRVASTLESIYRCCVRIPGSHEPSRADPLPEIEYVNMFRKCEKFYTQVLKENNVKDKQVLEYLCKVTADINS